MRAGWIQLVLPDFVDQHASRQSDSLRVIRLSGQLTSPLLSLYIILSLARQVTYLLALLLTDAFSLFAFVLVHLYRYR